MDLGKLDNLSSKYSFNIYPSDKKYYKKYNYKLSIKIFRSHTFSAEDFQKFRLSMLLFADSQGDKLRVEGYRIQYYTNNVETLGEIIENFDLSENNLIIEAYFFPDSLPSSIRLRKTPVKYPWEVIVKSRTPTAALVNFYNTYYDSGIHVGKNTMWNIGVQTSNNRWQSKPRTKTYAYTNWRFEDEALKNMFLLAFSEHVKEEILYQHQPVDID